MIKSFRLVLGITGASGMPLVKVLLEALLKQGVECHTVVSATARQVIAVECPELEHFLAQSISYDAADFFAPPASGSWQHKGMIICPCSMSTLAHVAHGTNANLVHRAAEVTLKEGRSLVLVPRETPLSAVHLANMLAAKQAGAVIFPPTPAFYQGAQSVNEMLAHMAGRILDQLGLEHNLCRRWGEPGKNNGNCRSIL